MSSRSTHDPATLTLLNRDHSILAFNERVLQGARREDVPVLERLRFLTIVSSNLDEFFEVRMEPHVRAARQGDRKGAVSVESFAAIARIAHELVDRQYAIYNDELMPLFAKHGIRVLAHGERNDAQRKWVKQYFDDQVRPLLVPVGLDPAHPFPQVANKSLNFIVRLGGEDVFGRKNEIAIVKVPRVLPRLIRLPDKLTGSGGGSSKTRAYFVSLSSVIRAHLRDLFGGREVGQFSQFRVTRHSDLAVDEEDVKDLRSALRDELHSRNYGQTVRLEVSSGCSEFLSSFLLEQFDLPHDALYRVHGPVNLARMSALVDQVDAPALRFAPYTPSFPLAMRTDENIFDQLKRQDVLIHQPYESFDGVLSFLRQAVQDPQVLAIKQTIYRTGSNPALIQLLQEAVRCGKEVTAVVELKARFDEEANINWAEALESVGAQVVYGVVGLKTHAKMLLVTRREGKRIQRYAHLSTGNYNATTARLYTDISHLTANPVLTQEVEQVLLHLASQNPLPRMKMLRVAPFGLHGFIIDRLSQLGTAAKSGADCSVVVKMNALTDEPLIRALLLAAQSGVNIDLIVRGACMLPAQVPGVSDLIRVRSVIGRLLEHSRVFYFRCGEDESLYLSSADWMNRNMVRRIELAWPIQDPALRQRLIDECLVAYLHDTRDAWQLQADGTYRRLADGVAAGGQLLSAQRALMARYGAGDVASGSSTKGT